MAIPSKPTRKPDVVPEGWYTREQLQNAWNLSQPRTLHLIKEAVDRGDAKIKSFRIQRSMGLFIVPHYQFKV